MPKAEEYVSTPLSSSQPLLDFDFDDLAARLSELFGSASPPRESVQSFDYVLSIDGSVTEADKLLGPSKVHRVEGGFMVRNITGVKAYVASYV